MGPLSCPFQVSLFRVTRAIPASFFPTVPASNSLPTHNTLTQHIISANSSILPKPALSDLVRILMASNMPRALHPCCPLKVTQSPPCHLRLDDAEEQAAVPKGHASV